jgi:alpha-1,2-rhamnosyltransferase
LRWGQQKLMQLLDLPGSSRDTRTRDAGPEAAQARVYFDCTVTIEQRLPTGIQRVVRNVTSAAGRVGREFGFECLPVAFHNGVFSDAREGLVEPAMPLPASSLLSLTVRAKVRAWIAKVFPVGSRRRAFALLYRSPSVRSGIVRYARRFGLGGEHEESHAPSVVSFAPGDFLVLLDLNLDPELFSAVAALRARGVRVAAVVYDLIPLRFPDFHSGIFVEEFSIWIHSAMANCDCLLAISRAVQNDLNALLAAAGFTRPTGFFYLGSALSSPAETAAVREKVRRAVSGTPEQFVFLNVGWINPRKNHAVLLDAFEHLWNEGSAARLVIVGQIDLLIGMDVARRINSHPMRGRKLFVFHDLSDLELEYCYGHCSALVYPSLAEGFGLPLIEALLRGLPVLASDIDAFREVGGDWVTYFDARDAHAVELCLRGFMRTGRAGSPNPVSTYHWIGWEDSARQLLLRLSQGCAPDMGRP